MPRVVIGMVVLLCAALAGCGGKGGDGGGTVVPPPPTPTFKCSGSPAAVDQVVLRCGVQLSPNVWQIDVVIGVPTESIDIDGFAFDVVFDPTILAYVPGSARSGNMLFQPPSGTPLISAQTAPGDPGRLVVGIHRTGTSGGVQGVPGYELIMVFSMKAQTGAIFDPYLVHFENYQALDSSDQPISSISFSDQLLLSYQ